MSQTLENSDQSIIEEKKLDIVHEITLDNSNLKREIDALKKENQRLKEIEDRYDDRENEIKLLKLEIEQLKKEKTSIYETFVSNPDSSLSYFQQHPINSALINSLVDRSVIKSKDVEEVLKSISRDEFCTTNPFIDSAQQIGYNTTISAPHMHATQLEYLKDALVTAKKALDIGTGSGFMALCMAKLMKSEGAKVYALDHIKKILELAKSNISKSNKEFIDSGKISFIHADGRLGNKDHAPYDVIFVGGSIDGVPDEMLEQLSDGGTLLAPIGINDQDLTIFYKTKNGIQQKSLTKVMFGRLKSVKEQCPDLEE